MLRQYLHLDANDRLEMHGDAHHDPATVMCWRILSAGGQPKGTVMLYDKLSTRRSWPAEYRLTQRDAGGKVVVDKLMETSPLDAA